MKTCSTILCLIQTLKGPHVHTHFKWSMRRNIAVNIYIKLKKNSGCSWIETLDISRADCFPSMWQILYDSPHTVLPERSTNWSHMGRFSNNTSEHIIGCLFFIVNLCLCQAENGTKVKAITSCKQNWFRPPNTAASSPTCAEMRRSRWGWSLPPRTSIFGGAQTERWPWCRWVPSATTERSQAAILAIYISCQLGSCFFSCSRCARQAWSLLWWSGRRTSQHSSFLSGSELQLMFRKLTTCYSPFAEHQVWGNGADPCFVFSVKRLKGFFGE